MRRFARILTMSAGLFFLPTVAALAAPADPAAPAGPAAAAAPAGDEATCALPAGELARAEEPADVDALSPALDPADEPEPEAACNIVFFCTPEHFIICGNKTICPCECE